jgi:glycosyltransferase involved in cell wall biosynthesis
MKIAISVNIPLKHRTGVEEYIYHLLWNLSTIDGFKDHQFFILTPEITETLKEIAEGSTMDNQKYTLKELKWPFRKFWTIIRLSWEMRKKEYDILFVPAHTLPFFSKKTKLIVTVQGLEFKKLPKMYPKWKRIILNWTTKRNAKKAGKIIVPSLSTKNDLIKYYCIDPEKIFIVYHGVGNLPAVTQSAKVGPNNYSPYILYLGRGDRRKNIKGLIKAFGWTKHRL